ncbi:glutaredoxin family protein [Pseudonocardia nigra]|uniref:glutaredoxin family protein n=1 Tax=Pseudonocardia nigra TaxID=1921578 RepID=UPI0027E21D5A|nr:glutaredoxin domain-containing protein [Pseudonocardia nigra]
MDEAVEHAPGALAPASAGIEVLWRPGCPYCSRLRRGLARAGIATVERNIWTDPAAAARVRAATGGDETVPTVVVGDRALVNPSVAEVVSVMRAEKISKDAAVPAGSGSASGVRSLVGGAVWAAVVALVWVLLAVWRPTTTWHVAPALLAAAWPWVVAQDLRGGDRAGVGRLVGAGVGSVAVAALVTLGLDRADLLRGPTVLGLASATVEALMLAGAAAVVVVLLGLGTALRTSATRSAWVRSQ